MVGLQQLWVQEVVGFMVKNLEQEDIHKVQALMFQCSASCYEGSQASVHQCTSALTTAMASGSSLGLGDQRLRAIPGLPGLENHALQR
uniref:Protein FAM136A n=1 Tax=Oryctolagus cuniculus TaxID=9986 RepID=A0A5F9D434_RABIT